MAHPEPGGCRGKAGGSSPLGDIPIGESVAGRWCGEGVVCDESIWPSLAGLPNARDVGDLGGLPGLGKVGLEARAAAVAASDSLTVPVWEL